MALDEIERQDYALSQLAVMEDTQIAGAMGLLEGDYSAEVSFPWRGLQELTFGPLAGEFWIIGARPSGGKTTFVMNLLQHLIDTRRPTLFVGMETNPERLRVQWAAWACGLDLAPILRKQWYLLPNDAQVQLRQHLEWQRDERVRELVTFAEDERLSVNRLRYWMDRAAGRGVEVVVLDHLHRMDYGGSPSDLTGNMNEGMVQLKSIAKERNIRLIATAQLKRLSSSDVLEDYMPPALSSIKQAGAAEAEADSVLLLHRSLKPGASDGDCRMVRQGQLPISAVAEQGTMAVRVGKLRLDGDARDRTVPLYVHKGRLFNSAVARDEFAFRLTGSTTHTPYTGA